MILLILVFWFEHFVLVVIVGGFLASAYGLHFIRLSACGQTHLYVNGMIITGEHGGSNERRRGSEVVGFVLWLAIFK